MEQPDWVNEGSVRKYVRALAQLTKEGKEITEPAVKELYVKWGGLVLGDASTVLGADNPGDALATVEEQQPVKPAKAAKKK